MDVWNASSTYLQIKSSALESRVSCALAAACPFCITMFEDGIKGVEAEERFKVMDLAEILAESLEKAPTMPVVS